MNTVTKGRARQQVLFDFLSMYPVATTDQLATLIWGGDQRLARAHLLGYARSGQLRRLPHPLYRNGAYVYTLGARGSGHSQKVLHHLALVDFHIAVVRQVARYGARVMPEMPWGPGLVPDQTVMWSHRVWAVEHHRTGQFGHADDYRRFMEEEAFALCSWWKPEVQIGLLVLTSPAALEHVRGQIKRRDPPGMTWRVVTREGALRDVSAWLKPTSIAKGEW